MTSTSTFPPLRRALLHPAWLASVATLALNDHVLKGSELVPGWVTGKLSDVVGLFAAPLLLAVLLRTSSRRRWAIAHVAIGMVFSAIQLSTAAADAWSGLMGTIGFPWAITSDPTDLLALPALALSYVWIPKLARGRTDAARASEVAVASVGVLACVATSPPGGDPFYSSFDADTYLHNANDYDVVLRIRTLAPTVELDCDLVEEDPAGYLREPLFTNAESWTLAPDATMPVIDTWNRSASACHAAWIDADNLAPSIIFWREGQFPIEWVEGTGITEGTRGWISIAYDDDGRGRYETEEELAFRIEPLATIDETNACTPTSAATRLAWGDIPSGQWRLGAADEGPDGCVRLDLRTGLEDELDQTGRVWDICLPGGAFPFEAGDQIELREIVVGPGNEGLEIVRIDPLTAETGTSLVAWRGNALNAVFNVQPLVNVDPSCAPLAEEVCGTVRQAASVTIAGGGYETVELSQTQDGPTLTQSDTHTLELYLVHASERLVANTACGEESTGDDIELVAIRRDREGE